MYVQHFGLKSRPFRASATGPDVFVGPQTAKTMAGLKKALSVPDAVVTVSGPVGVGKTTLVHRALNALGSSRIIISVGRMHLDDDEVLELLLDELGTRQTPTGTVQRFSLFRRLLKGFAEKGTRVFIVVEDATRIGNAALSELEALTAADAGVSDGANIVLMGEPGIRELLKAPELARLKQRIRFRESIGALSSAEMGAYLKHGFRQAGGDFDAAFDRGTAELLYQQSGGIPRVVNNTIEMILGSAAEQKVDKVTAEFLTSVIADECGITGQVHALTSANDSTAPDKAPANEQQTASSKPIAEDSASDAVVAPSPVTHSKPEAKAADVPVTAAPVASSPVTSNPVVSNPVVSNNEPVPEAINTPDISTPAVASAKSTNNDDHDDTDDEPIPELIQDTLPNLSILPSESAVMARPNDPSASSDTNSHASTESAEVGLETPELILADAADTAADSGAAVNVDVEADVDDADIPTLFSSGRMTKPVAAPSAAAGAADEPQPIETKPVATPTAAPVAEQISKAAANAEQDYNIPAWDRDPTLAELRPDLEALEQALSRTIDGDDDDGEDKPEKVKDRLPTEPIPEITLDRAIQEKIDEATELLNKTTTDLEEVAAEEKKAAEAATSGKNPKANPAPKTVLVTKPEPIPIIEPEPKPVPAATDKPVEKATPKVPAGKNDRADLEKMSSDLANAKSIGDIDDKLAETLFGEEFSRIAAEVVAQAAANGLTIDDDSDEYLELVENDDEPETNELRAEETASPDVEKPVARTEEKPVVRPPSFETNDNMSATQRLRTVRELNGNFDPVPEATESVVLESASKIAAPPSSGNEPESIEDQINTSMTQTLKALNVRPPPTIIDDDDDDEGKTGFFNRFRRS